MGEDAAPPVPLVIDNGSGYTRAGYAGEDSPRFTMPTAVHYHQIDKQEKGRSASATPSANASNSEHQGYSLHVGNEAFSEQFDNEPFSAITYPMRHGIVRDLDLMENIWQHIFDHPKLDTSPERQTVLLTEANENPKENRLKIAEIMFEKFKVPSLYFSKQCALDIFSTGRTTGLVVDIGHTLTQIVPVYEGFSLSHASARMEIGGEDLTQLMKGLLRERLERRTKETKPQLHKKTTQSKLQRGPTKSNLHGSTTQLPVGTSLSKEKKTHNLREVFSLPYESISGFKVIQDAKEKLASISLEYEKEKLLNAKKEYVLPDRTIITVTSNEMHKCPEALFNPSILNKSVPGIHEKIAHVFFKCDEYIKKILAQNILLAGGASMHEGMKSRLTKELSALIPSHQLVIDDPAERDWAAWVGGSMLASLDTFKELWITKQTYDEGKQSIFKNCI